jgi:putative transferase (TIGR04331 family)
MVSRVLVTTALEETWPADDKPVLFLGEWCRLYSRKAAWEKRDAVVAPYHWDDRKKLHNDYLYLQRLYEELLLELATKLNAIHGVNHSVRYWRIVVGPWLGYFIQMLFDRWAMLQQVVHDNDISGVRVLQRKEDQLVPNDMADFAPLFLSDAWNESIYGQILDWMKIPAERIDATHGEHASPRNDDRIKPVRQIKCSLARLASYISGVLYRDNEYFFISSYLGEIQNLHLQVKLGQIPKRWRPVAVPIVPVDLPARQWQLPALNSTDFPSLVRTLIPKQIPTAYLEGYRNLVTLTENIPWPRRPKAIFTSNSFSADDVFKCWGAGKVETGVPLVTGQHGGNYGMALWGFIEDYQIAIADRYLTWGWSEPEQNKIIPVGNFKGFGKKAAADKAGVALLVEMIMPRQSYNMYSAPVAAGQWQSYFDDQCRFVQALPEGLRDQLLIRLFPQDWGYDQKQRWQARFPDIRLDEGVQPMAALMKKSRLYISTYNATTYLESMSLNFPTIMFWNPKHWELRDSALPYFEKLKSVGIFHDTPESAAQQMAEVWDDVDGWWQSAAVLLVRSEFCERYARIPEKPLDVLEKLFRAIADGKDTAPAPIAANATQ